MDALETDVEDRITDISPQVTTLEYEVEQPIKAHGAECTNLENKRQELGGNGEKIRTWRNRSDCTGCWDYATSGRPDSRRV